MISTKVLEVPGLLYTHLLSEIRSCTKLGAYSNLLKGIKDSGKGGDRFRGRWIFRSCSIYLQKLAGSHLQK